MRSFPSVTPLPKTVTSTDAHRVTDAFISKRLPPWVKQASPAEIAELRRLIASHRASRKRVEEATRGLAPPHAYALQVYGEGLASILPAGQSLAKLQWREMTRRATGFTSPYIESSLADPQPGLLRLMQNFPDGETPLEGSGLFRPNSNTLLSGDIDELKRIVRELDAGAQYQARLANLLDKNKALFAEDKVAGFSLAVHIAALKKTIEPAVRAALDACVSPSGAADQPESGAPLTAYPGLLSLLGCTVHDGVFIQLRGADDSDQGVVVYLPDNVDQPLRHYRSKVEYETTLVARLEKPADRAALCQRVALRDRTDFTEKLRKRLADTVPDLQPEGEAVHETLGKHWADAQIARAKDDARLLLVPTADADDKASQARLASWAALGWSVANLAGFFIPVVGAALLAQAVADVCSHVFEGVEDWAEGHDHEAVEHVLDVARIAASVAITAGAVAGANSLVNRFARSSFVDSLEPAAMADGSARLWHNDLGRYESSSGDAEPDERGLLARDGRFWLRIDGRCYEVHQPRAQGPWRLRHPSRADAYGPVVEYNGERFWHLRDETPVAWNDAASMLDRLWPQAVALDARRADKLLLAAGADIDELRGILVENRPLPANLRSMLRGFDADARIDSFFAALAAGSAERPEPRLLDWCRHRLGLAGVNASGDAATLLEHEAELRSGLFTHLTAAGSTEDEVARLVMRDFPGLDADYAMELAATVTSTEREHIQLRSRLPLGVAQRARSLLQHARLARARRGLILRNGYSDESGELALHLLPRLRGWAFERRLELRVGGRRVAVLNSQAAQDNQVILTRSNGRFRLSDHRGLPLESDLDQADDDLFEAVLALLTAEQRDRLGLDSGDPAGDLRQRVVAKIPAERRALLDVLGWRQHPGWFNPGERLPDGRVGYALGGRQSTELDLASRMRQRLSVLYRGDSQVQIDNHLARILETEDPFDTLISEEENFQLLCDRLNAWVEFARNTEIVPRRLLATRLRQAWRRQLPVDIHDPAGHDRILDISALQVTSLPDLRASLDFHFVTTFVMTSTPLLVIPEGFFSCFTQLRRVNLSRNHLYVLPAGLRHLGNLQSLQLLHNHIRINEEGERLLGSLPQLTDLDLSFNPLRRLRFRFDAMPALRRLYLRHCGLVSWPAGLERCGMLNVADLSVNEISSVPEVILQMPYEFRLAFRLDGNAVSVQQRTRLHAVPHPGHAISLQPGQLSAWQLWGGGPQAEEMGQRWNRLFARPGMEKVEQILSQLQHTKDFQQRGPDMRLQVWSLLEEMDQDAGLAGEIQAIASAPTTCADSIAERFSDMRLHAMIAKANSTAATSQESLLSLGLGLCNLSKLEEFIRMDLATRQSLHQPVDPIEVKLSYCVALAQELNLPGQPTSIRYGDLGGVGAEQLDAARAFVRTVQTVDAQASSICLQTFWTNWLEEHYSEDFAVLAAKFDERVAELTEQAEPQDADQRQAQWDDLEHQRISERYRLAVQLTRDLLEARAAQA